MDAGCTATVARAPGAPNLASTTPTIEEAATKARFLLSPSATLVGGEYRVCYCLGKSLKAGDDYGKGQTAAGAGIVIVQGVQGNGDAVYGHAVQGEASNVTILGAGFEDGDRVIFVERQQKCRSSITSDRFMEGAPDMVNVVPTLIEGEKSNISATFQIPPTSSFVAAEYRICYYLSNPADEGSTPNYMHVRGARAAAFAPRGGPLPPPLLSRPTP